MERLKHMYEFLTPENKYVTDITVYDHDGGSHTIDTENLTSLILFRHGDKYIYFPDFTANNATTNMAYIQQMWRGYTYTMQDSWNEIYNALIQRYSPIENTDRYSEYSDTKTGTDTFSKTGKESNAITSNNTFTKAGSEKISHDGSDITEITGTTENSSNGKDNTTITETNSKDSTTTYNTVDTTSLSGTESSTDVTTYDTATNAVRTGTETTTKENTNEETESKKPYNTPSSFTAVGKTSSNGTDTETLQYGSVADDTTKTGTESNVKSNTYNDRKNTNTKTGTETVNDSGTTTTTNIGTNENKTTTTDNNTNTVTYGGSETTTYTDRVDTTAQESNETHSFENRSDTTSYNNTGTHTGDSHGNIGVTTNMAMVTEEVRMRMDIILTELIVDGWADYIAI